jgi:Rrf2 family protein
MNMLKKSGYVVSSRGVTGGYRLSKPPSGINLAEIIRLIDGPIAPIASVSQYFYQHTPSEQNDKLLACFKDIRDYAAAKLEELTLDKLT